MVSPFDTKVRFFVFLFSLFLVLFLVPFPPLNSSQGCSITFKKYLLSIACSRDSSPNKNENSPFVLNGDILSAVPLIYPSQMCLCVHHVSFHFNVESPFKFQWQLLSSFRFVYRVHVYVAWPSLIDTGHRTCMYMYTELTVFVGFMGVVIWDLTKHKTAVLLLQVSSFDLEWEVQYWQNS